MSSRRGRAWVASGVLVCFFAVALLANGVAPTAGLQRSLAEGSLASLFQWWALATRNTFIIVFGANVIGMAFGALFAIVVYRGGVLGVLGGRAIEWLGIAPGLIVVGILRFADPTGGVLALLATLSLLRTLEVAQLVRAHVIATIRAPSRGSKPRAPVLPKLVQPLAANGLVGAASLVGLEAALSFTGLGLPTEVPSWGGGLAVLAHRPAPVLPLALTVASIGLSSLAFYMLGAGLARIRSHAEAPAANAARPLRELGAEGRGG